MSYETKPDEGRYNRKIRFALLNRNVSFAEAVDLIFHLQDAAKRALPHATQVADRYHLVHNLREHLQQFLDRKRTWLPEMEDSPLQAAPTDDRGLTSALETQTSRASPSKTLALSNDRPEGQVQSELPTGLGQEVELAGLTYAERKKKISRDKRYARYEQVLALHQAGMGQRAIARQMHMSRRIVRRFLTAETFPERAAGSGRHPKGTGKLDPIGVKLSRHRKQARGERQKADLRVGQ